MSTRDGVIQWLKEKDRLNQWGMIAALSREMTNRLLLQEYIARHNTDSYLKPLSVMLSATEERTRLESIVLDKPRLSFENSDVIDSRGRLRMQVVGGNIVTQKRVNSQWVARKIEYMSPVLGPELLMNIELPSTPVSVQTGGAVVMDLKYGGEFLLTHVDDPEEQKRAGYLFADYFKQLSDSQRRYTLGRLQLVDNFQSQYLKPESFSLRVQGETGAADAGAILIFTQMKGANSGVFPGKEYRSLIASGDTATVLIQSERYLFAALQNAFTRSMNSLINWDFTIANGVPVSAVAMSGEFNRYPIKFTSRYNSDVTLNYELLTGPSALARNLKWEFKQDAQHGKIIEFSWRYSSLAYYRFVNTSNAAMNLLLAMGSQEARDQLYRQHHVSIDGSFIGRLWDSGEGLKQQYSQWTDFRVESLDDKYSTRSDIGLKSDADALISAILKSISDAVAQNIVSVSGKVKEAATDSAKLNIDLTAGSVLSGQFNMIFGQTIVSKQENMAYSCVAFGDLAPSKTAFAISPVEHVMSAGEAFLFNHDAGTPVTWRVEAIGGGAAAGEIDAETGMYKAPLLFEGSFTRTRIIATNKAGTFFNVAMVTTLKEALHINPLVQATQPGVAVTIKAGAVGASDYQWTIKQTGMQGKLSASRGAQVIYTPRPANEFKDIGELDFVVDEITATGGGGAVTTYMINTLNFNMVVVEARDRDVGAGSVQLQALIKNQEVNAEWSILLGSGKVDSSTGVYQANKAATDRFVVVQSTYDTGPLGIWRGYIILPLPLAAAQRALPGTVEMTPQGQLLEVRALN
jgi:hypothetical protein